VATTDDDAGARPVDPEPDVAVGAVVVADDARSGVVVAFDARRGVGLVRTTVGERLPFHCVALLDGTRTVAVGTPVRCGVAAGVLGRWEAVDIAVEPGVDRSVAPDVDTTVDDARPAPAG
jgi:hypothetical protein